MRLLSDNNTRLLVYIYIYKKKNRNTAYGRIPVFYVHMHTCICIRAYLRAYYIVHIISEGAGDPIVTPNWDPQTIGAPTGTPFVRLG